MNYYIIDKQPNNNQIYKCVVNAEFNKLASLNDNCLTDISNTFLYKLCSLYFDNTFYLLSFATLCNYSIRKTEKSFAIDTDNILLFLEKSYIKIFYDNRYLKSNTPNMILEKETYKKRLVYLYNFLQVSNHVNNIFNKNTCSNYLFSISYKNSTQNLLIKSKDLFFSLVRNISFLINLKRSDILKEQIFDELFNNFNVFNKEYPNITNLIHIPIVNDTYFEKANADYIAYYNFDSANINFYQKINKKYIKILEIFDDELFLDYLLILENFEYIYPRYLTSLFTSSRLEILPNKINVSYDTYLYNYDNNILFKVLNYYYACNLDKLVKQKEP